METQIDLLDVYPLRSIVVVVVRGAGVAPLLKLASPRTPPLDLWIQMVYRHVGVDLLLDCCCDE